MDYISGLSHQPEVEAVKSHFCHSKWGAMRQGRSQSGERLGQPIDQITLAVQKTEKKFPMASWRRVRLLVSVGVSVGEGLRPQLQTHHDHG